ncbi:hypothetical protein B0O80DRAFT_497818 [Mortierella sp. GBAus27b]|nr:hypothetical protein B0O80DRAFT_497818 [Mortierella sp. GBAus27b]
MVQVSAGVNARLIKAEQLHVTVTMSILHEKLAGCRSSPNNSENLEQECGLDDNLKCSFRNPHNTDSHHFQAIQKTAKADNASCFILDDMSVSLNRINAQTVRAKYMAIGSWSSSTIKMVKPPPAPPVKIAPTNNAGVFRAANHSTKTATSATATAALAPKPEPEPAAYSAGATIRFLQLGASPQ